MPNFTDYDAILILQITYIIVVVSAVMLLVVRPLVTFLLSRWVPQAGASPSRNRLMVRTLTLSPFVISTLWLDSSWALIGAVYDEDFGSNNTPYGSLYLIPAMFVVVLNIRSALLPLGAALALCVDTAFRRIDRVSLIILLRHALFKTTLFLLHTPARRTSLVGVSLAGILLDLAVRHTIMPWELVTEYFSMIGEIETVSLQSSLMIAEISITFFLFFLIFVLVVRPLLSFLFNALPSWGAEPAPPWERRVLFWLLVACLFYGYFLLAIH